MFALPLRLIINRALSIALLGLVGMLPVSATGQSLDCDLTLRQIVEMREFRLAYFCADRILETEAGNIDALLVKARAAQELGDMGTARALAKQARRYPLSDGQRFAALLISGMAEASQKNLIGAKILLYRASDFARLAPEVAIVKQVLQRINSQSPWRFSIGGGVSPSDNINGGSLHDSITFGADPDNAKKVLSWAACGRVA